jgi:hypothetical protein
MCHASVHTKQAVRVPRQLHHSIEFLHTLLMSARRRWYVTRYTVLILIVQKFAALTMASPVARNSNVIFCSYKRGCDYGVMAVNRNGVIYQLVWIKYRYQNLC